MARTTTEAECRQKHEGKNIHLWFPLKFDALQFG